MEATHLWLHSRLKQGLQVTLADSPYLEELFEVEVESLTMLEALEDWQKVKKGCEEAVQVHQQFLFGLVCTPLHIVALSKIKCKALLRLRQGLLEQIPQATPASAALLQQEADKLNAEARHILQQFSQITQK